ncbi:aminoacyl-tRNA hydrolase [Candidatus Saccharibacteria bacterium]|nr:aminoacyl-tRNA hydrolase [Candidatus Saccharibacteria bacterium]
MKLIVGLGNPGKEYHNTRHNVGQWFIDAARDQRPEIRDQVKLYKTSVFMNESGREVKKLVTNYSLPTTNLLIVHDDLDLDPGKWKLQFGRSSAGHKGVQSVVDELRTQDFWRLRIGIGKPNGEGEDYVLGKPAPKEKKLIDEAIEDSIPKVLDWISGKQK